MLTASYHILKGGTEYQDLGAEHFARRDRGRMIQRLVRWINDLGCPIQLTPAVSLTTQDQGKSLLLVGTLFRGRKQRDTACGA
jgi:hypothetical protein